MPTHRIKKLMLYEIEMKGHYNPLLSESKIKSQSIKIGLCWASKST